MRRLLALLLFLPALAYSATTASVGLAWTRAASHDAATTFRIYQGVAPGVYAKTIDAGTTNEFDVPDLVPGTTYFFVVTARQDGLESLPSNEVSYAVPTGAPATAVSGFDIIRELDRTAIRWAANPADQKIFQYEVTYVRYGSPDQPTSVMATGTSVVIPTDRAATYLIRIRAIGPAGAGPWLDRTLPEPPTSVLITRGGTVQYRWTP